MMYRGTILTVIVYLEMYRDKIFTIEIYPDMCHDTVSLAVSSRFSCVLCFCACMRTSFVLFGYSNTRVSPDVSSLGSLSKVSNAETSQLESVGVDQVGNREFSCCVLGSISWYEGE